MSNEFIYFHLDSMSYRSPIYYIIIVANENWFRLTNMVRSPLLLYGSGYRGYISDHSYSKAELHKKLIAMIDPIIAELYVILNKEIISKHNYYRGIETADV